MKLLVAAATFGRVWAGVRGCEESWGGHNGGLGGGDGLAYDPIMAVARGSFESTIKLLLLATFGQVVSGGEDVWHRMVAWHEVVDGWQ